MYDLFVVYKESLTMTKEKAPHEFEFPNVFREAFVAAVGSVMVFTIADVRDLARTTDNFVNGDRMLDLPLPMTELRCVLRENDSLLQQKLKSNHYDPIRFLSEDYMDNNFPEWNVDSYTGGIIHHFGDDNALHECVHVVHTSPHSKQVVLTFRGSITAQDWMTDATLVSGQLANPLFEQEDYDDDDQPEFLGVHVGFRDYLYGNAPSLLPESVHVKLKEMRKDISNNNNKEQGEEKPAKIKVILEQVQELMDQYPDYTLCITGHSLGGALAQLACLEAAVQFGQEGRPVTCITIASPRVGDHHFRGAIQTLEQGKRLRFLAVRNSFDLVPLAPNRFCRCDFCRPNEFCQPGVQLKLSATTFVTEYHFGKRDTRWEEFRRELLHLVILVGCCIRMAEQHNYRTYLDRLLAQKDELSKLYLNDLYKKQNIHF
jgi:hypothetical protein